MKGSLLQGEIFPLYMDLLSYDIAGDPVPQPLSTLRVKQLPHQRLDLDQRTLQLLQLLLNQQNNHLKGLYKRVLQPDLPWLNQQDQPLQLLLLRLLVMLLDLDLLEQWLLPMPLLLLLQLLVVLLGQNRQTLHNQPNKLLTPLHHPEKPLTLLGLLLLLGWVRCNLVNWINQVNWVSCYYQISYYQISWFICFIDWICITWILICTICTRCWLWCFRYGPQPLHLSPPLVLFLDLERIGHQMALKLLDQKLGQVKPVVLARMLRTIYPTR